MNNLTFDNSKNLTVDSKPIAQINRHIRLGGTGTELPITIIADFKNIPVKHHEMYLRLFQDYYTLSDIQCNIYNNTEPEPKEIKKKEKSSAIAKFFNKILKKINKKQK